MSAYMVNEAHIRYLVEAAHRWGTWKLEVGKRDPRYREPVTPMPDDFDPHALKHAVGAMLWAENRASINHRYSEDKEAPEYTHVPRPRGSITAMEVLSACRCYAYQSCEHPGWEGSKAKRFIDDLQHHAVSRLLSDRPELKWGPPDGWDPPVRVLKGSA